MPPSSRALLSSGSSGASACWWRSSPGWPRTGRASPLSRSFRFCGSARVGCCGAAASAGVREADAAELFRAVEAVARVSETRDDEAVLVQATGDGGADDVHVRMLAGPPPPPPPGPARADPPHPPPA